MEPIRIRKSTLTDPSSAERVIIDNNFMTLGGPLALQLKEVAEMIAGRDALGSSRQIFHVQQNGYDTHSDLISRQQALFDELGPALVAFQKTMNDLGGGLVNQVTTYTMSDFGRTFGPASQGGTDHGWGNHHLIMGGAVVGKSASSPFGFYGTPPDWDIFTEVSGVYANQSDVNAFKRGRWLPTTSVDQYANTLARWFGVSDADRDVIFPNLSSTRLVSGTTTLNFTTKYLGFMG